MPEPKEVGLSSPAIFKMIHPPACADSTGSLPIEIACPRSADHVILVDQWKTERIHSLDS